jgi:D-arabinan endo alpha-(1,5)-arabinofuranosidase
LQGDLALRRFNRPIAVLAALVVVCLVAAPASAQGPTVDHDNTGVVGKVTGPGPLNFTDVRWNVLGTDLGSMFEFNGRTYMVFGDTFGRPQEGDVQAIPGQERSSPEMYADWRSNTIAWLTPDSNPEIGPRIEGMFTDPANPLRARELLPSAKQTCTGTEAFCEQTVIPTYGFAVGSRMYLHYISIKKFEYPGPLDYGSNYSGIAWSGDGGNTWTKDPFTRWPNTSDFALVAATRTGGDVYLFGIPSGRFGDVKLARVKEDKVLRKSAYRYWDGRGWSSREDSAAVVAGGPVGEPSVQWNSYFGKWLMTYLEIKEPPNGRIALRTADCLTGPWSDPQTVVTSEEYPSLYGPFIPPRWNDGPNMYFALSIFLSYNVYWVKAPLTGEPRAGRLPCVSR